MAQPTEIGRLPPTAAMNPGTVSAQDAVVGAQRRASPSSGGSSTSASD